MPSAASLSPCADLLSRVLLRDNVLGYTMQAAFTHSGQPGKMEETAIVQGGFLAAALNDAGTTWAHLADSSKEKEHEKGRASPSLLTVKVLESKVSYLLPVRIGALTCEVVVRRLGGSIGYVEVVAVQQGKTLATASLTLMLTRKPFANVNKHQLQPLRPQLAPRAFTQESQKLLTSGVLTSGEQQSGPSQLGEFFGSTHQALDLHQGTLWSEMAISQSSCDENGHVQSGFVSAMLDNAMAMLFLLFRRWEGVSAPTIEMSTKIYSPVEPPPTKTQLVTRIVHISNQVAFLEAELFQDDQLKAKSDSAIIMTYAARSYPRL
jgi:acyl-coenzyme A thioesterase PaaI-like protein